MTIPLAHGWGLDALAMARGFARHYGASMSRSFGFPAPIFLAFRCLALGCVAFGGMAVGAADEPAAGSVPVPPEVLRYTASKVKTPIVIDGKLDDAGWARASWTADFVDIEGDAKPKPRFRTRAKMTWDDRFLYIAAELEEPDVWATLTQHDSVIFHDPDFEVFIDPDGDTLNYYEFEINALNTGWDLLLNKPYRFGGKASNAWEIPGLQTAVRVEGTLNQPADRDRGWTVEIAMPWTVLKEHAKQAAPPRPGDVWRINFSRVEWQTRVVDGKTVKLPKTKEDNWVWSPQGVINMHVPEKWGAVTFVSDEGGR